MKGINKTPCRSLAYLSIAVPLISIAIAILLSDWFSITNNALSDLGHATKSPVAPIFNFGLSLGGALIVYLSALCMYRANKAFSVVGFLVGFTLILVAVFDEVYGRLHFAVSVAFFLSLAVFLIAYGICFKSYLPLPALGIAVVVWVLHFTYDVPKGAAIPELISIFATIPFYLDAVRRFQGKEG
ncbi:DUF998 domain-containing protein [Thermococcus aggregans]|uniref:DUF998 domain-containing protein n=1 Tax=Thermococcus aggregans TaxID=110163 RepID=A0A9E7MXY5_THEAG|nr:DUF998 domain-containing protein [Thermococcus aggregans]USS40920.1 DUF998 domain-containing protein [Thermococcus aggregans]